MTDFFPPRYMNKYIGFDDSGKCTAYEIEAVVFKSDTLPSHTATITDAKLIHKFCIFLANSNEHTQDVWASDVESFFSESPEHMSKVEEARDWMAECDDISHKLSR